MLGGGGVKNLSLQQRIALGSAPAVQEAFPSNQKKLLNKFVVRCRQGDCLGGKIERETLKNNFSYQTDG